MPYIITMTQPKGKELSLDQLLFGDADVSANRRERRYPGTITRYCESLPSGLYTAEDVRRLIHKLSRLDYMSRCHVIDMKSQYQIFKIPKRNGGERTICSPLPRLYEDQVNLRTLFEKDFGAFYHTSAFAYCKGRSIKHCMERHQANKSQWFLKLDFENFFGNTNKEFVLRQLEQIAPYSEVIKDPRGKELMCKAIDICFLDGGLPQGTPISPMLTNLVMIPFDHAMNRILHSRGFVYTRYADDIQISHKERFNPGEICNLIKIQLREMNMPYKLKTEKTRFGSRSGQNWNLGLMLNKDNDITIGHEEHKRMKARIHSFILDYKHYKRWSLEETQKLAGQLAYFRSVEPNYTKHVVYAANKKHKTDFERILRKSLKPANHVRPDRFVMPDFFF